MRYLAIAFAFVAVIIAGIASAPAATVTKTYKEYPITILVTPSPVAALPGKTPNLASQPAPVVDPLAGHTMVASANTVFYDVPVGPIEALLPRTIAQTNPQRSVPVQFNAKADPYANYLRVMPQTSPLMAGYGTTTFTCAVKVYGYFATQWRVVDWVYGTANGAAGSYPSFNYPTPSDISWLAQGVTTSFTTFYNNGPPGELAIYGTAGQAKTVCIDLSVVVPSSQPSGYYSTTVQYTLQA